MLSRLSVEISRRTGCTARTWGSLSSIHWKTTRRVSTSADKALARSHLRVRLDVEKGLSFVAWLVRFVAECWMLDRVTDKAV
jgi:hypothetical protein